MGSVIDEHQARLDSMVSCRCGDKSRTDVDRAEDGRRSASSYMEPTIAGASPATIPTSAPMEGTSEDVVGDGEDEVRSLLFLLGWKLRVTNYRTLRRTLRSSLPTTIQGGLYQRIHEPVVHHIIVQRSLKRTILGPSVRSILVRVRLPTAGTVTLLKVRSRSDGGTRSWRRRGRIKGLPSRSPSSMDPQGARHKTGGNW